MARAAESFARNFREMGWRLDYSAQSIREVDEIIGRLLSTGDAINPALEVVMAAYYGEAYRRVLGGRWTPLTETSAAVTTDDGRSIEPETDIRRRIADKTVGSLLEHLPADDR